MAITNKQRQDRLPVIIWTVVFGMPIGLVLGTAFGPAIMVGTIFAVAAVVSIVVAVQQEKRRQAAARKRSHDQAIKFFRM